MNIAAPPTAAAHCLRNLRLNMRYDPPRLLPSTCLALAMLLLAGFASGCIGPGGTRGSEATELVPISLADPADPEPADIPLATAGARNEWIGFAVQVTDLPPQVGRTSFSLTLTPRNSKAGRSLADPQHILRSAYQVIPVPADLNRPGFVRQTGRPAPSSNTPGALLPLPLNEARVDLANLRDPDDPTRLRRSSNGTTDQPLLLWIDLRIPPDTPAGDYAASLQLHRTGNPRPIASMPITLTVYDFDLPDRPTLRIVGRLDWQRLENLHPRLFQQVPSRLLNRHDPRTAPAVELLDQLVQLARQHRTSIIIPRLQPTVKWGPAGRPPQIDWADYDSLVSPWLDTSEHSTDTRVTPLVWALPEVDQLGRFNTRTQGQYWEQVIAHFQDRGWLEQSILFQNGPHQPSSGASLSAAQFQQALALLEQHPDLTILLPHRFDAFAATDPDLGVLAESPPALSAAAHPDSDDAPQQDNGSANDAPDHRLSHRLFLRAPGPAYSSADNPERNIAETGLWLAPGPNSSTGTDSANAEPDLLLWAWLALIRNADTILWDGLLPRGPQPLPHHDQADAVWFYPGQWFGTDQPVPALQLKWLRRAQQDYEYLVHALRIDEDDLINVHAMARLLVRPVRLPADRLPDPLHYLLAGTSDPDAWEQARRLLAQAITLDRRRDPQTPQHRAQRMELSLQAVHWTVPLARPVLLPRSTAWSWPLNGDDLDRDITGSNWLDLRLDIEIYTPTLTTGLPNQIEWLSLPPGWSADPNPLSTPPLETYEVTPFALNARVDLNQISPQSSHPLEVRFTDGYSSEQTLAQFAVPVAAGDFRNEPIHLDGSLEEWHAGEALHDGPLIQMFSRPAIQKQALQPASTDSAVYAAWNDDALLLAFRLEDATADGLWWRNFVDYRLRRAWGEDLCQILIQPVYLDNTTGPVIHIACKPRGQWVEQKNGHTSLTAHGDAEKLEPSSPESHLQSPGTDPSNPQSAIIDPQSTHAPWQPVQGAGIRYAATLDDRTWRGELAVPWEAILEPGRGRPALLRFNFSHHRHSAGESASWAGPVDFGRDDAMMGLIILRQPSGQGLPAQP